ncbi:MAG: hypothetical protein MUO77_11730 [Anaerolineales bacterium]|nr:hypothetical protein [Anaerolineales bacterium]
MKRKITDPIKDDDILPEYDFTGKNVVRGKHAKALREGYTVTIHKEDGTTVVQNYNLQKNAVVLDPDVYAYFPDSESVNNVLRSLIALAPKKSRRVSEE